MEANASNMSKIIKVITISAYAILLIQYINMFLNHDNNIIEISYKIKSLSEVKKIHNEIIKMQRLKKFSRNYIKFNRTQRLPTDLKFILKWTEAFYFNGKKFGDGQSPFVYFNCSYINCFMTHDRSLLVEPWNFDAILFDVENNWDIHPPVRADHQKFIFTAYESSENLPVCQKYFDSYYNLTWTYRLDSDIRWSYITILDKEGNFVGPKTNMNWIDPMKDTLPKNVEDKLTEKKRGAAWIVSNCNTKSVREVVAKKLIEELENLGHKVDVYGRCGKLTCSRDRFDDCLDLLQKDYYFYFAFENSLSEDYVTEKLLHAVLHYTVPVVYGGANYSRFLPPASYLDARKLNAKSLAVSMDEAIKNFEVYKKYFRWHNYYEYSSTPPEDDICKVCEILNKPTKSIAVKTNFREWWNPQYKQLCKKEYGRNV